MHMCGYVYVCMYAAVCVCNACSYLCYISYPIDNGQIDYGSSELVQQLLTKSEGNTLQ